MRIFLGEKTMAPSHAGVTWVPPDRDSSGEAGNGLHYHPGARHHIIKFYLCYKRC